MKSAQINKYGSSDVIESNQNTSEPTLSSGKVLVSVKTASVNPVDWKIREGGLPTNDTASISIYLGDGFFRYYQTSWERGF